MIIHPEEALSVTRRDYVVNRHCPSGGGWRGSRLGQVVLTFNLREQPRALERVAAARGLDRGRAGR